ncbi:MAG TPA: glycosyltransferase [Pyrinomonadaceae bacterium]|nr:glycosyltransferase [Pyrinomonadaceae bacterium]
MSSPVTKPKILIIGDAVAPTGFGRVIRNIFEPLHHEFELHQLATRFAGEANDYPWTLYPANKGKNVYGFDQIESLVPQIDPAIIFLLYDIPFHSPYMERVERAYAKASRKLPSVVMYAPVESGPIAPELLQKLSGVSRYVLYTKYGRQETETTLALVHETQPDFHFPKLDVIAHGVETQKFYPLAGDLAEASTVQERRRQARRAMGFNDAEHLESFIVLNANKNMPRKRIDLTLQGFALFARDKPKNVKLYLHMATEDTGWNVLILAKRYGIFDRLIMSQADNTRPRLTDDKLNLLYNACDVGLTTTTGEGWGLVSFEHAATRAAQVMPRHTSLAELWQGAAEFVEPKTKMTWPGNLTEGHIVAAEDVAASLERLYSDVDYREAMAAAAYGNATRPEYDWKKITAQWQQLFNELLSRTTAPGT